MKQARSVLCIDFHQRKVGVKHYLIDPLLFLDVQRGNTPGRLGVEQGCFNEAANKESKLALARPLDWPSLSLSQGVCRGEWWNPISKVASD